MIGGMALVNVLQWNHTIKELILADNMVGNEVMTLLGGRLAGGVRDVAHSVKVEELALPLRYASGRFDRFGLQEIIKVAQEKALRSTKIKNLLSNPNDEDVIPAMDVVKKLQI